MRKIWADGNIPYLCCDGGYMIIYFYQSSQNCICKWVKFAIYKLCFKKPDFKKISWHK